MIELQYDPEIGIWCENEEGLEKLRKNFFGTEKESKIFLDIEEALYVLDLLNGKIIFNGEELGFNELASKFPEKRLIIKYNSFRDWRDRGLVLKREEYKHRVGSEQANKKYPSKKLPLGKKKGKAFWYSSSMFSILEGEYLARELFEDYWIGQLGVYKQERGSILKLDFMETVFLSKHFGLEVVDAETRKKTSSAKILNKIAKEWEYAKQMYEVYEDWRLQGFVVKTGFKFGSHFRIYFPGASPAKEGKWTHSRHVLHVFPKQQKLSIGEWARAVRVAHSVKKTFVLGIPEMTKEDYVEYNENYIAYRRKKEKGNLVRENPQDKPRFLLVPFAEDETIGGIELASLLEKSKELGVDLMLSISDRESAITYYLLKKIVIPGSQFEYYEIEWEKP